MQALVPLQIRRTPQVVPSLTQETLVPPLQEPWASQRVSIWQGSPVEQTLPGLRREKARAFSEARQTWQLLPALVSPSA